MRYDRTRIAIRQRGIWEILDLALRVTRIYARPLLLSALVFALPFALLNAWILHPVVADEYSQQTVFRYVVLMTLLVFLETPVATLPMTVLLGRVMFLQDLSWRSVWDDLREVWPGILWTQGLTRGGWLLILLMFTLVPSFEVSAAEMWLGGFAAYSLLLRMLRPFINEIVLLERNPIFARAGRSMTIGRRARALHGPNTADLVGRWLTVAAATVALSVSLVLTFWYAAALITNDWRWGPLVVQWIVPTALWLAAIYTTVVKFINFLDLRIRREGWEVELKVRAAAQELPGNAELRGPAV